MQVRVAALHRTHLQADEAGLAAREPERGLGPVVDANLPEQRVQMVFDGAFSYVEHAANLLVGFALCKQLQHLMLPRRESAPEFGRAFS